MKTLTLLFTTLLTLTATALLAQIDPEVMQCLNFLELSFVVKKTGTNQKFPFLKPIF